MRKTPKKSAKSKDPDKSAKIIALLQRNTGATITELAKATGWQRHSVHGFMSGTLKKKHRFDIKSIKEGEGDKHYWIEGGAQ